MLFFLAEFYAYWCGHNKVTANEKVGRFFEAQCIMRATRIKRHHVIYIESTDNRALSMLTLSSENGGGLVRSTITLTCVTHTARPIFCMSVDVIATLHLPVWNSRHGPRRLRSLTLLLLFFKASLHKFVV